MAKHPKERQYPKRTPIEQQNYYDVIRHDPFLNIPAEWREMQIKDHLNWTRSYLLPIIRVLAIGLIWLIKIIKRILPFKIASEAALNALSIWFVKRMVSPETEQMLYRHLAIENALIHFIANNCGDESIKNYYLRPDSPEGLGDTEGMNATLLHDNIILNLFIDLGKSNKVDFASGKDLDFSNLEIPDYSAAKQRGKRFFQFDFESVLYITVLVLVMFLDDDTMEWSVNSLNLDHSLMQLLASLTGDNNFYMWSPGPHVNRMHTPFDLGAALNKHINLCEYAYCHLMTLKNQAIKA